MGGWGIVEGFHFSPEDGIFRPYETPFNVNVSDGILIDKNGVEQIIPAMTMACAPPEYESITETLVVGNEGEIYLKYTPYSPSKLGTIFYNPPEDNVRPDKSELSIALAEDESILPQIFSSIGNKITINSSQAGKEVVVKYFYCDDRIDAVLLDEDGNYHREIGLLSTSPSVNRLDLSKQYLIGLVHWIVDRTITVEFIIDDRTYRKVYVNENNILYLNGKPYRVPKFIYFEEPENPEENDVWYDRDNNALMVYIDGEWVVMNDFTNVPLRSVKYWIPGDNFPADSQTFLFEDDEMNLRYVPDTNSVEVLIDNAIVMNDQFDEVILPGTKPYLSSGIGFKLKAPLDRPTVVEAIVHHVVKNAPLRNVFQRAAIFLYENYITVTAAGENQMFTTELPYSINASQLEVYVDGVRLNKDIGFRELNNNLEPATAADNDRTSSYFKVIDNLDVGQRVTYKISKYVWSYDQLNQMMEEIEDKADEALDRINDLDNEIANLTQNTQDNFGAIASRLTNLENRLAAADQYRLKADKITINDFDSTVLTRLFKEAETELFNASDLNNQIPNLKPTDFVTVTYLVSGTSRKLIPDSEFTVSDDGTINIIPELQSASAQLLVETIKFGVGGSD